MHYILMYLLEVEVCCCVRLLAVSAENIYLLL